MMGQLLGVTSAGVSPVRIIIIIAVLIAVAVVAAKMLKNKKGKKTGKKGGKHKLARRVEFTRSRKIHFSLGPNPSGTRVGR